MTAGKTMSKIALQGMVLAVIGLAATRGLADEIVAPPPSDSTADDPANDHVSSAEGEPTAVLGRLHLANIRAIVLGKQAGKKGRAKEVRELGSELVRDHTAADKRLLAFAKQQKVDVSVTGQTLGEPDMDLPRSFDEKFAEGVLEAHRRTLADVHKSREASTDPTLSAFLQSLLPMLEHHIDAAQQLVERRPRR